MSAIMGADLHDAWAAAVADGRYTASEAVDGILDGVFPESIVDDIAEEVATPALEGEGLVIWYREKIGRKFETPDLSSNGALGTQLYDAATNWLLTVDMDHIQWSDWLVKLATKLRKYKNQTGLTNGEAKGVLNSMYATLRRQKSEQAPQVISAPVAPQKGTNRGAVGATNQTNASIQSQTPIREKSSYQKDADDAAWDAWCGHVAAEVTKGFFTLVRDDGSHRTFKVGKWNADNRSTDPEAKIRWIGLLVGPQNTSDYETVGFQRNNGDVVLIRQYRQSAEVKAMVELILCGTKADRDGMRKAFAMESGTCAICNRLLTTPESVALGIGPECSKKGWV